MKLVTYNVEWFDRLFNDKGNLIYDGTWSGRWDVTRAQQIDALAHVFRALDADAVMIIEAPDTSRARNGMVALETFAETFGLRAREALIGFANDTQQEIALLYDPDKFSARHSPLGSPRFDEEFRMDVDIDAHPDPIRWSKPPLEVALSTGTQTIQLIGVHAKSKAPHGATNHAEATRISISNRRKQLAQCIWLRQRVEQHLAAERPLIVMGDFNDGPGLDEYEKLFGRSSIEIVLGEGNGTQLFDPHARIALSRRLGAIPTTSRFRREGQPYLQALLDYIMVSPDIAALKPDWQIWHPFDHPACYEDIALREALLDASDHFPVMLTLPD
ncbi:Endonuclease/Exonuclease/phosphatase family protein [Cognatiyoonia koreensis]|uniref:Endonuclease/Exonuclease/phosphatase family protein n=1 Tax=Cognatiyoonia koreensis TaxID=364200 RepID=A0A1I0QAY7_9RHOB|nr:endonuclease/exonuclease/phosphatase family protein [Cognatiyoonia koreensis]SEW23994.1 Endonuclease/Exonuclease/phosphatase family protein [Cognatiyoonia koreensis]